MITPKITRFLFMLTGLALLLGWLIGMVLMWVLMSRTLICS